MKKNNIRNVVSFIILLMFFPNVWARENQISLPEQNITFESYLNRVGKQNLGFMAARLNVDIAEAELIASKVLSDPSLDFEANKETYSLGLSYSLELGKRHARTKLAKSEKDMAKLALEQDFQELRAQAAELYLDAYLQKELLKVKESSYQYMVQLSLSDSLRFMKGEVTENDARQSKLEAVGLLNEVYDQEATYCSALDELNRFMGVSTDTLNIPAGDWNKLDCNFTLLELLDSGLKNRVELLVAAKQIEVNKNAYKLVKAERRPDLDLSVSYEREWGHFMPRARYATAGISVPLSFSAINKGELKAARFRTNQSELLQKDVELQVGSEIRQSWFEFEAEKKKVLQYQSGVLNDAKKVMDGMVYKYQRGEASILDVLIAQRTYNDVSQDYLETRKGFISALVNLEKACGIWDIHF